MKTLNHDYYETAFQLIKNREDIERLVGYAKNDLGLNENDCNIRELNMLMNGLQCDNNIDNINDLISYLELAAELKEENKGEIKMKTNKNDLINGLKYYSDYINNKNEVLNILSSKNIEFKFIKLENNQYNYLLTIDDMNFKYFEGIGNECLKADNLGSKVINAVHCLLLDASFSDYSLDELFQELGYSKPSEAIKVHKGIKKNTNKLKTIFTDEELQVLSSSIEL